MRKINSILIVDDDQINNFINRRILLKFSAEIHVKRNGQDGINFLHYLSYNSLPCPELILLDINMPVMDGFEFLEAFKEITFDNKEKVQIIVLTTSTNPRDLERMKEMGINHFFIKPLYEEKLMRHINDFLDVNNVFSDKQ